MFLIKHIGVLVSATVLLTAASASAKTPAKAFGAMVLVGDIIPSCPKEICSVEVVPAPPPGRERTVGKQDVVVAVERAGFAPSGLKIPPRRRVTRPSKRVSEDVLRNRILAAVQKVLPSGVFIEELGHLQDIEVPRAGFDAVASWPGDPTFKRRVAVPVDLVADGNKFLTIQVSALLVMETDVPVASRDLQAGTLLTHADVTWKTIRVTRQTERPATSFGEVVGQKVTCYVPKGAPFEQRNLDRIPVVQKGGQLTVESVFGLVRVKTTGVVKQDGAVGDRVRVILVPANRTVWAEIVAPGRAVVMP